MIRKDIKDFLATIPSDVTVVAASKYVDSKDIKTLLENGVNNFGENRVEAFLEKYDQLKQLPILWHFIGHLQTNKAKLVLNKIKYLHSLDSLKLAGLIDKYREEPLDCFIEVSVNGEENKDGVSLDTLDEFVEKLKQYKKVNVIGLMMMSVKGSDENSLDNQFSKLREIKDALNKKHQMDIKYLSMGMSGDYIEAIKCGATHIRLGRILFDIDF